MNMPVAVARLCWHAARLSVVSMLMLFERSVMAVCSVALNLGVIASVAFEISAVGLRFPFLAMLGVSLGFGIFMLLYQALIALLIE
jgi:hypothetical protein